MIGKISPDHVDDLAFAFSVHRSHQVDSALVINRLRLLPVCTNDGAGGVGRFPGDTHEIFDISVDRHQYGSVANESSLCYLMAREDSSARENQSIFARDRKARRRISSARHHHASGFSL